MKKRILLFTVVAGMASIVLCAYPNGPANNGYDCTGAESAGTGTFANPTGCWVSGGGCHHSSATASLGVAIELDSVGGVPTTHYKGGLTYIVKITGTATGTTNTHYGFQLNALKGYASTSSNADAGTWAATGLPSGTQLTVPGTYTQLSCLEQSVTQTLTGGTFTKSFTWTAPVSGTGTISFWGAANFVDNDTHANTADVWNTNHVVINEWTATTAVANVTENFTVKAFPNPVFSTLNLQVAGAAPGSYTIRAYDMTGRMVCNQDADINNASEAAINTSSWAIGIYHVVIENGGSRQVISVAKQ